MSREKQMFNDLVEIFAEEHESRGMITPHNTAKKMTEKGYVKQEWISVDERLPEKFTNVLCLYPSKNYGSNIVVDYMESDRGCFAEQFKYGEPTHWMPLTEAPKGGEE